MAAIGPERQAQELLRRAREHLRAGRPTHAEALAEVALAWDTGSDEAMAILGDAAWQRDDHARAAGLLAMAIEQRDTASRQRILAHSLVALERHTEAVAAFRRAALLAPDDGGAANDLGVALARAGDITEAEVAFRRAIALQPELTAARDNLATALRQLGRHEEVASLAPPAASDADAAAAQDQLADALSAQARHGEAVAASRMALAMRPDDPDLRRRHADRLQLAGDLVEAEAELRLAIAMQPDCPAAYATLGWVLRRQDRLEEAISLLSAAAARWPDHPQVLNSLAIALLNAAQPHDALTLLERAAKLAPDDAEVQHNRSILLLRLGRFREGWEAYEWRWRMAQGRTVHRPFHQNLWTGEAANGQTILLHAEQGFGDTLQFLRFVPLVAARGLRVILEVPAPLGRLVGDLPGVATVVWVGDPLPPFDLHCPLMSLPRALGTTLESIPQPPYLRADPRQIAVWHERFARAQGLRIGLIWAGRPEHRDDARRSLPFAALAPVWSLSDINWFSLQIGPHAADLHSAPAGAVTDLGPMLSDFADTAAALSALDLLISVDTAAVHLAGALGRPAWLLLAHAADWRWLHERDDTPWYPSLRLFRQATTADWDGVVARVAVALVELSRGATVPA